MGLKRYISNWLKHDIKVREQFNNLSYHIDAIEWKQIMQDVGLKEFQRKSYLQECVMHCADLGISSNSICEEEVIVSLTSFGNRINEVYLPIESIMQGTIKPNKIILWLPEEKKCSLLPTTLQRQQTRGLQVEYCKDIRSYKKLIPTLQKYPNANIITIDDDIMYDFDFVENLIRTHIEHPGKVCANRIHKIKLDSNNQPISYLNWDMCSSDWSDSKLNFLTGGGGVLYPPHVFPQEVFNVDVFMNICKYADDVWFNAMLLLNNVDVIKSYTHTKNGCDFIGIENPQETSLCSINNDNANCLNDIQIKAVFEKYQLYNRLTH